MVRIHPYDIFHREINAREDLFSPFHPLRKQFIMGKPHKGASTER